MEGLTSLGGGGGRGKISGVKSKRLLPRRLREGNVSRIHHIRRHGEKGKGTMTEGKKRGLGGLLRKKGEEGREARRPRAAKVGRPNRKSLRLNLL